MKNTTDIKKDSETKKKTKYSKPRLSPLGSISTLTLGHGGSSMDGTGTHTQRGGGNDGRQPHGG